MLLDDPMSSIELEGRILFIPDLWNIGPVVISEPGAIIRFATKREQGACQSNRIVPNAGISGSLTAEFAKHGLHVQKACNLTACTGKDGKAQG
jgi:hypothetical protein